jgi:hypothetical protein
VHKYIEHVREVEDGIPVNEPTNWARVWLIASLRKLEQVIPVVD